MSLKRVINETTGVAEVPRLLLELILGDRICAHKTSLRVIDTLETDMQRDRFTSVFNLLTRSLRVRLGKKL